MYAITDLSTRVGILKSAVLAEILTFLDVDVNQVIMFVRCTTCEAVRGHLPRIAWQEL